MSSVDSSSPFASPSDLDPRWRWVSAGLKFKLVAWGLLIGLLVWAGLVVFLEPRWFAEPWVAYGLAALFLLALVIDLAGRSMCLVSPLAAPSRKVAALSVGCQLAAIALLAAPSVLIPEFPVFVSILLGLFLAAIAQAVAAKLFMNYTRQLALALGRTDLADLPNRVLLIFGVAGASLSTAAMTLLSLLVLLIICPCLGYLVYIILAPLAHVWNEAGYSNDWFWPMIRLLPVLLAGYILYWPLSFYGTLVYCLIREIDGRVRSPVSPRRKL